MQNYFFHLPWQIFQSLPNSFQHRTWRPIFIRRDTRISLRDNDSRMAKFCSKRRFSSATARRQPQSNKWTRYSCNMNNSRFSRYILLISWQVLEDFHGWNANYIYWGNAKMVALQKTTSNCFFRSSKHSPLTKLGTRKTKCHQGRRKRGERRNHWPKVRLVTTAAINRGSRHRIQ